VYHHQSAHGGNSSILLCPQQSTKRSPMSTDEGSPSIAPVTLNQEELAEMIGTTRSRVSFFMNKFRRLGWIDYNGMIQVHQSLLSAVLHDKPEIKEEEPELLSRLL
jgi:CRP-like cAMP-binding protein